MRRFRLRDLRDLFVVVVHPPDTDGQAILNQMERIGCRTELVWPPRRSLPANVDVVFLGLFFDSRSDLTNMIRRSEKPGPAIIGVVDYENPAMLEFVLEIGAIAVTSKPVRSFGILTNLVVGYSSMLRQLEAQERITRLEKKLLGKKTIAKAKAILIKMHGLSEEDAYKLIREQSMYKRTSIEDMAQAIINANELLSGPGMS
ncbi:MAG: ANTAR domain-containing protein [Natronohydrobacter sp.]|nr:ANTAR domain-containing protein [Natronohydrobacter sp.]